MTSTNTALVEIIHEFGRRYVAEYNNKLGHDPVVEKDEAWPSQCIIGEFNEELNTWKPSATEEMLTFENVEQALDIELHQDVKEYFGAMFSESIQATCEEGHLSLLFAWSKYDFERLQQNLIGHVLMKRKLKQSLTVFFAVTDQDDMILSVKNDSGEVWVEKVGAEPHKKVADSLINFMNMLAPHVETSADEG